MNDYAIWICATDQDLKQRFYEILNRNSIPVARKCLPKDLVEFTNTAEPIILLLDKAALREIPDIRCRREFRGPVLVVLLLEAGQMTGKELSETIDGGVDDFIPVSIDENVLLAKIRAYLRRLPRSSPEVPAPAGFKPTAGRFKVDPSSFCLLVRQNGKHRKINNFTPTEFKILSILIRNRTLVVERKLIIDFIWGGKADGVNFENIDKHVESIRRKLGPHGKKIKTVYGLGYMFVE